jgi:hypothetical protein
MVRTGAGVVWCARGGGTSLGAPARDVRDLAAVSIPTRSLTPAEGRLPGRWAPPASPPAVLAACLPRPCPQTDLKPRTPAAAAAPARSARQAKRTKKVGAPRRLLLRRLHSRSWVPAQPGG